MKKITAILLSLIVAINIAGCSSGKAERKEINNKTHEEYFDELCSEFFSEMLKSDRLSAHYLITDEKDYGIEYEGYEIFDFSREAYNEACDYLTEFNDKFSKIDASCLSEGQKVTYDILNWYLNLQTDVYSCNYYINNFLGSTSGIIASLSTNFTEYAFYSAEDADDYLEYLKAMGSLTENFKKYLADLSESGYMPGDTVLNANISICDKFLNVDENPYIVSFEEKIKSLGLDEDTVSGYIEKNREYVDDYCIKFYSEIKDTLTSLLGKSGNTGVMADYGKDGIGYYEVLFREKTSSDMTVDEGIKYIDKKIKKLINEMVLIVTLNPSAYDEFISFSMDDLSPQEIMDQLIDDISEDYIKPLTTQYEVDYLSEACEIDGVSAYYLLPRIDDISINRIKVNGSAVSDDVLILYMTLAHEGIPGHMYQFTSFYGNDSIPFVRKILGFIGVTEGWAEYAADSSVSYLKEKYDVSDECLKLIEINNRLIYLISAKIDTGVHYEGWDVKELGDYLDSMGYDSGAAGEIYNEIVCDAGVILPYAVGTEKMFDLKNEMEDKYSEDGNRKFNDFIIETGVAPFPVYEELMKEW